MADPTIEDLKKKQQGLPTRADYEAVLRPGSQLIIDPDTKEVVGVRGSPAVGRQTTAPTLGSMAGGMPAGVNPDDIGRTDASTPTLGGMGGGSAAPSIGRAPSQNSGQRWAAAAKPDDKGGGSGFSAGAGMGGTQSNAGATAKPTVPVLTAMQKWKADQEAEWARQQALGMTSFVSKDEQAILKQQRQQQLGAFESANQSIETELMATGAHTTGGVHRVGGRQFTGDVGDLVRASRYNLAQINQIRSQKWPWEQ